jgi:hypothetical protein
MKKQILATVVLVVGLLVLFTRGVEAAVEIVGGLPNGQVGVPYSAPVATNWIGDSLRIVMWGPLPAGLQISNQGILSGTPTETFDGIVDFVAYDADQSGQQGTLPLIIVPAAPVVSTGKMTADVGKVTAMGSNYMTVNSKMVRLTTNTMIVKLNKKASLTVGQYVAYTGMKNTDGSVTAMLVLVGK